MWLYPTGWCDVGYSAAEVVVKEVLEETGIEAEPVRLIAVLDGLRLGFTRIPLYSLVFHCRAVGGTLSPIRSSAATSGWFAPDQLPTPLVGVERWGEHVFAALQRRASRRPLRPRPPAHLARDDRAGATGATWPTSGEPRVRGTDQGRGRLTADRELIDAIARSGPAALLVVVHRPPTSSRAIVESPATTLFVARDGRRPIVGSLTLAVFRVPTGVRAWIEDVVVDGFGPRRPASAPPSSTPPSTRPEGRGPDGGPHLPARPGGGQPPLPAAGVRAAGDQRLPPDDRGVTLGS